MKKLILLSGSPCVGKTTVGQYLFEQYENSAYLDGDWCWRVNPFSVTDKRLRNGDKSMSFVLSNYLESGFEYAFFYFSRAYRPKYQRKYIERHLCIGIRSYRLYTYLFRRNTSQAS